MPARQSAPNPAMTTPADQRPTLAIGALMYLTALFLLIWRVQTERVSANIDVQSNLEVDVEHSGDM
jgi:hypothetical protein